MHIGPSTAITQQQFTGIKWGDPQKAAKDLLLAVFGRAVLRTHSYTGRQSNAFADKPAKPQLNVANVSDVISELTFSPLNHNVPEFGGNPLGSCSIVPLHCHNSFVISSKFY